MFISMESVGKFEFNRKDLVGHGAFAVVFKGRHKEKRDWEVAVKCINKKNFSKSQALLGKEIKILKELRHENIVRLLDYQEMGGCIYLIMEYCNGGDLAEYLQTKGTLSEDTIRVFLQQIAKAMKVLQSKGILHRDLKPQNILLCHPEGRKSSSINTSIKIADFGFARHLQLNTMAATLCGSPMYMAPEVIMSQNYDAKADLWSIGTIVYQCLTGKAPFHASSPQELRLFYESNETLLPSIPKETSAYLRHLLLGLLKRNHKERMSFEEFFHHPFLESSLPAKTSGSPSSVISYTNTGSGSSSCSSSTSQLASPQHSDGELHLPTEDATGLQSKAKAPKGCRNPPSCAEDYVMVPAELSSVTHEYTSELEDGSPTEIFLTINGRCPLTRRGSEPLRRTPAHPSLLHSPNKPVSNPVALNGRKCSPSVPIPVPTQIHNYQRMARNLQPVNVTPLQCGRRRASCPGVVTNFPKLAKGGAKPEQSSPTAGMTPKTSEQIFPLSTRTGLLTGSPDAQVTASHKHVQPRKPNRTLTASNLQCLDQSPAFQNNISRKPAIKKGPFKRSLSTGRLSDMLLKAAFGANLFEEGCDRGFSWDNSTDTTAPPTGCYKVFQFSDSPPPAVFAMGSPPQGNLLSCSPTYFNSGWILNACPLQRGSRRKSETEAMDAIPESGLIFHPPELPEDTLMEQVHTDALSDLRFTLAFVTCVMELASSRGPAPEDFGSPDISFLEQSIVADQISLLSREWSYAEQLVLYMKAEEFLSSALHTAKENIKQGQLQTSSSVKQVIRKLNNLYKNCVTYCRSLNDRLQTFLLDKQKLMDRFNSLTAEKLIYGHTVHMIQSAALDEMFHHGAASVQRYNKALLLMEGLSRILTEQKDIDSIEKCKKCIERRLSALQT
ncbi:serine/threonine-protein kinase ULK1a isoform X1 [Xiphophorus couchianus]|uniref:serine/threonine-protein kinase ULK1a isoform X1 n=1 Tax=Xiphophorus couchianus TaxID=32473 RepID=UPI001016945C|nr:serine/threonine-protein kinase ULK1-like isoform X1 [Xiphophorus couchianus]